MSRALSFVLVLMTGCSLFLDGAGADAGDVGDGDGGDGQIDAPVATNGVELIRSEVGNGEVAFTLPAFDPTDPMFALVGVVGDSPAAVNFGATPVPAEIVADGDGVVAQVHDLSNSPAGVSRDVSIIGSLSTDILAVAVVTGPGFASPPVDPFQTARSETCDPVVFAAADGIAIGLVVVPTAETLVADESTTEVWVDQAGDPIGVLAMAKQNTASLGFTCSGAQIIDQAIVGFRLAPAQ